ncbi:MAG: tetratricopeptide repeat-containing protein [Nautiliaceae bacterium]
MPLTKTYAQILENQGFKYEALEIYKQLLKKYPNDKELKEAIKRLKSRKKFKGVNIIKLQEFDKINQKNRYEFEKWLSEI